MLPDQFKRWFFKKCWQPRPHQLALLKRSQEKKSTLLIAPTGSGKTLAGFLPSLVDLAKNYEKKGLHTLYISPLKALAKDIERNLKIPIEEIGLSINIETRTGDTPAHKRRRQKMMPPDILLTTPEQVSLLLSSSTAKLFFKNLDTIILDEVHALVPSKRGHLLSLALARLHKIQPRLKIIGLSATVSNPDSLRRFLVAQNKTRPMAGLIIADEHIKPNITLLQTHKTIPWAGHSARYASNEILMAIENAQTALLFVNTRSQAEMLFQELWRFNEKNLPIALHHGSLDVGQRRKVEEAMAQNLLRAVIATSTLDLGIDWGNVDLVIHIGAPKGASRLAQRIGRANHRMDEPSNAILVPANCFEVLECQAALNANYIGAQDSPQMNNGAIDVLAQHILGMACAEPFSADALFEEIKQAEPYYDLERTLFDEILNFVATGGYALKVYDHYAKIRQNEKGLWRVSSAKIAQRYRLNIGTIIDAQELNIRLITSKKQKNNRRGQILGRIEESFVETLTQGDTFIFGGRVLSFETIHENECYVRLSHTLEARVPAYLGGKLPLSTYLATHIREILADPKQWISLPQQVQDWLNAQQKVSLLPKPDQLLIETWKENNRSFLIAYPFEGRLAHQTLGMLLTRRLERSGFMPIGFIATDYSIGLWTLGDIDENIKNGNLALSQLFNEDILGDDLEEWLEESALLKRSFRNCAMIAGLSEKKILGKQKTARQITISTDLIFDVLRRYENDHILLKATRQDAAYGLLDIKRLVEMLARIKHHIVHQSVKKMSPLALPIMLEIGKEMVSGSAREHLLMKETEKIIAEICPNGMYERHKI